MGLLVTSDFSLKPFAGEGYNRTLQGGCRTCLQLVHDAQDGILRYRWDVEHVCNLFMMRKMESYATGGM